MPYFTPSYASSSFQEQAEWSIIDKECTNTVKCHIIGKEGLLKYAPSSASGCAPLISCALILTVGGIFHNY